MKKVTPFIKRVQKYLHRIEDASLVIAFSILLLLSFSQIIMRNFFSTGLYWGDAAARYLVLWVGLLGAMAATRDDNHISIDIISRYAPDKIKPVIRIMTDSFTAVVSGILAYISTTFIIAEMGAGIKAFASVPTWITGLILPAAFGIICIRYTLFLFIHIYTAIKNETPLYKKEPGQSQS